MAEVLAHVTPASQRLAANLKAIVCLVTPVAKAWTADLVAAMVAAHFAGPADLRAKHLRTLRTHHFLLGPAAATLLGNFLLASATCSIMAALLALVRAADAPLPTALATEGQGVCTLFAATNPTNQHRRSHLAAAFVGPSAGAVVTPGFRISRARPAFPLMATLLAGVRLASQPAVADFRAGEFFLTANPLLLLCTAVAALQ